MAKKSQAVAVTETPSTEVATIAKPATLYTYGEIKASPRVDHNKVAWSKIETCLSANPEGATQAQILAAMDGLPKINPPVMLAYLVSSKWLMVKSTVTA